MEQKYRQQVTNVRSIDSSMSWIPVQLGKLISTSNFPTSFSLAKSNLRNILKFLLF